ncbi:MAG: C40 family peptidase [Gammaproteobacteria bacterium]|nr:C40 family peptidase [Gammaproteobacteria bacterium]
MPGDKKVGLSGLMAFILLAAGCAGAPVREPVADGGKQGFPSVRRPIVQLALSMVGVPYRYGGSDPAAGFDCSGLVYYSYTTNGHAVPRTSQAQYDAAFKIPLAQAAEGDLLFFRDQEKLSHVAIYIGDGRFVHAPSSGDSVRVAEVESPYYQQHLVAVGRLLP